MVVPEHMGHMYISHYCAFQEFTLQVIEIYELSSNSLIIINIYFWPTINSNDKKLI